jgi:hypothetical protein
MGLNIDAARYLISEKERGVILGKTLTLGRQAIYIPAEHYGGILEAVGEQLTEKIYADDLLRGIGTTDLISMDFSDYEGAQLIHDANEPISKELHGAYDTVIDGGTLEHIFNFPVSIRNCMEFVKTGGRVILLTPWHNYSGHGFYEFSPELLWSIFAEKNGFEVEKMMFVADGNWFSVKNPAVIKQRIEIRSKSEILLFMTARKTATKPIFQEWPQQSDYVAIWTATKSDGSPVYVEPKLKTFLLENVPGLRCLQRQWNIRRKNHTLKPANNNGFTQLCSSDQIPPP